jgi:hypothetical protein
MKIEAALPTPGTIEEERRQQQGDAELPGTAIRLIV